MVKECNDERQLLGTLAGEAWTIPCRPSSSGLASTLNNTTFPPGVRWGPWSGGHLHVSGASATQWHLRGGVACGAPHAYTAPPNGVANMAVSGLAAGGCRVLEGLCGCGCGGWRWFTDRQDSSCSSIARSSSTCTSRVSRAQCKLEVEVVVKQKLEGQITEVITLKLRELVLNHTTSEPSPGCTSQHHTVINHPRLRDKSQWSLCFNGITHRNNDAQRPCRTFCMVPSQRPTVPSQPRFVRCDASRGDRPLLRVAGRMAAQSRRVSCVEQRRLL